MADITSQISTLSVKLTMYRASDESTKTRTFSVRDPAINEENPEPFRQSLQALQNFLLGDGKTLIQPTGWRDDDATEGEYTTTAVEFTTEEGVGTKWDTRLTHNMQLSQTTIAGASISTNVSSPTEITITGSALASEDLRVTKPTENEQFLFVDWALMEGDIIIALVKDGVSTLSASDIVFEIPAEGVYQTDSVTLSITGG